MTQPLSREPIKFGGLRLDANQIKSKRNESDILGRQYYIVEFKSGVTAKYQYQIDKDAALNSYEVKHNVPTKNKDIQTEGWNIKGLTIEGSREFDNMIFTDCEDTTAVNFGDGIQENCHFIGGKYNRVFDDKTE